jgi:tetratricopeptide (TPR) repeat protein
MSEVQPQKTYLQMEALAAVRKGELDTGMQKYREYLQLNPQDDDAWAGLGGAYRRKDDIDQALKHYQEAYRLNPQSTYALVNIISLLAARYKPGDVEALQTYVPEAMKLIQQLIAQEPGKYWTWYDLATAQLIQDLIAPGKTEEAIKTFSYAVELTPQMAQEQFHSVLSNLTFLQKHNPRSHRSIRPLSALRRE